MDKLEKSYTYTIIKPNHMIVNSSIKDRRLNSSSSSHYIDCGFSKNCYNCFNAYCPYKRWS